jgi:hypothetical protein
MDPEADCLPGNRLSVGLGSFYVADPGTLGAGTRVKYGIGWTLGPRRLGRAQLLHRHQRGLFCFFHPGRAGATKDLAGLDSLPWQPITISRRKYMSN